MTVSNQMQSAAVPEERLFLEKALASVEKARRLQRIKQIVVTILAFLAAFWLALKPAGPELNLVCTVIVFVGLMLAACTAKIMSLINTNTKALLQAISDLHRN